MKLITTACVALSILFSTVCSATNAHQTVTSESAEQITIGQWYIGLSAGIGVMTNPLQSGDNLPLIVVPEIAYYGEQFFFDNGRVGYSLIQTEKHIVNLVSEFNPETRFFVDWHPSNIFALQSSSSLALQSSSSLNVEADPSPVKNIPNLNDLNKRRWALDMGLSYHYIHKNHVFSVQSLADVSGVYNGTRTGLQWQMMRKYADWQVKPSLGIWYKSSELNTS
ncbi:MipA/OmpV family protein [Pseudoalteromonas sp.]|uniref:MipA/OmpV family protein n=1 Tax=Pseudoalteromonas sp. TaxID=53249 RepID=UPI003F994E4D